METKNAEIESASITKNDHGYLGTWLQLNCGKYGQSFGGWALCRPESHNPSKTKGVIEQFIFRIMEIAGVTEWEDLKGKTIRIKIDHGEVCEIGHVIKEDWFNPTKNFKITKL